MIDFIEYVKSFYSQNGGLYSSDYNWSDVKIEAMCRIRMEMTDYAGDSFDREWVRNALMLLDSSVITCV